LISLTLLCSSSGDHTSFKRHLATANAPDSVRNVG
jgi:hypothetical protein